jgi:hypothetical protein
MLPVWKTSYAQAQVTELLELSQRERVLYGFLNIGFGSCMCATKFEGLAQLQTCDNMTSAKEPLSLAAA